MRVVRAGSSEGSEGRGSRRSIVTSVRVAEGVGKVVSVVSVKGVRVTR